MYIIHISSGLNEALHPPTLSQQLVGDYYSLVIVYLFFPSLFPPSILYTLSVSGLDGALWRPDTIWLIRQRLQPSTLLLYPRHMPLVTHDQYPAMVANLEIRIGEVNDPVRAGVTGRILGVVARRQPELERQQLLPRREEEEELVVG